jgi:capsular exopolysaccharide synthesis family protein
MSSAENNHPENGAPQPHEPHAPGQLTPSGNGHAEQPSALLHPQTFPLVPAAGGPLAPTPTLPKITPKALLLALRRRWLVAICLAPLAAVLVAGIVLTVLPRFLPPPTHTVQTLLRIAPNRDHILFPNAEGRPELGNQATQMAMVRSRLVLNIALREDQVAKLPIIKNRLEPVEWLEKQLKADFSISPEILRIYMMGEDTDTLKIIVQAVTETYVKEIADKEHNKRRDLIQTLKEIHADHERNLQSKRKILKGMVGGLGNADVLAKTQEKAVELRADLEKQLFQNGRKVREMRIELAYQKRRQGIPIGPAHFLVQSFGAQGLPPAGVPLGTLTQQLAALGAMEAEVFTLPTKKGDIPPALLEQLVQQDPAIVQWNKDLAELNKLIAEIISLHKLGEKAPQVQRLREEAEKKQQLIAQRRKESVPNLTELARLKVDMAHQNDIAKLEDKIGLHEEWQNALEDELKGMSKVIEEKNLGGFEQKLLQDEIKRMEDVAQKAADRALALEVESRAPSRTQLLQKEAVVVAAPPGQREKLFSALAGVATLALVLFLIAWLDFRARRVNAVDEVITDLGVPVVGIVPTFTPARQRLLASANAKAKHQQALLTESVDATRTMLLHAAKTQSLRVLLITSALEGEGKTSLSSHLALSLVRAGFKTLLIDCDLRRPTADRLFNVPLEPGFCELLRGETDMSQAVRSSPVEGLDVVTAGRCDRHIARLLAQGQSRALFDQLKQQYDCVIVDSAPLLPVVDSLLLAQQADAVLLSVLNGVSRQQAIQAAYQRLQVLGVRVLGAVVNGAQERDIYHCHHYSYAYLQPESPVVSAPESQQTNV